MSAAAIVRTAPAMVPLAPSMRYLFALLLAAVLIAAMLGLAAAVRAQLPMPDSVEPTVPYSGGQLLLISLARTIERFAWPLATVVTIFCLAAAAFSHPRAGRPVPRQALDARREPTSQAKEKE